MIKNSKVFRKLTDKEKNKLIEERNNNSGLWMRHPMKTSSLDDGKTIPIKWVTRVNLYYQLQWSLEEKFPNTMEILKSLSGDKNFGKIYWHWLEPGIHAKPHCDTGNIYIQDNNTHKRFTAFFDIEDGVEVFLDEDLVNPVDKNILENSFLEIAVTKNHAVNNYSKNKHFYCLIFDILNEGIEIYNDLYCLNTPNTNNWRERLGVFPMNLKSI